MKHGGTVFNMKAFESQVATSRHAEQEEDHLMKDSSAPHTDIDRKVAALAAELTAAAYAVALRHSVEDTWLDLQLELWRALTEAIKRCIGAWPLALIALGLVFTNAQGADPPPAPPKVTILLKNKLEAAQKAFRQAWENQGGDVEVAYRWSCRWLEAERALSEKTEDRLAALQSHLERVREIEQVTRRQFRERITSMFQVRASEFFVAEAEVWVAQAIAPGAEE
jgi:hypothetical protein